jgi:transposase
MAPFRLRPWEHRTLLRLLDQTHDATQLRRAQALVWLHEGRSATAVADLLRLSRQTVHNWVRSFQDRVGLDPPGRSLDAPRSGRPATASGVIDPLIDTVIDADPRGYGSRCTVWTAPLLQRYLEEVHQIRTSRKSVSRALARLGLRWKRPRHRLGLRPDTWRQAKGGSNAG